MHTRTGDYRGREVGVMVKYDIVSLGRDMKIKAGSIEKVDELDQSAGKVIRVDKLS